MPDYDPVVEAEANLAVARLERRLGELREDPGADPEEEREVKYELRAARQAYREMRETQLADGDAVVAPDPVAAKTTTKKAGD